MRFYEDQILEIGQGFHGDLSYYIWFSSVFEFSFQIKIIEQVYHHIF